MKQITAVRSHKTKRTKTARFAGDKKQRIQKVNFIDALLLSGRVLAACDYANIHRSTAYRWKNEDDAFRKAWFDAKTRAKGNRIELLEEAAMFRAVDGVPVKRYDKDANLIYETTNYSDSLTKLLLQSELPDKYTERKEIVVEERQIVWDIPIPQKFLDNLLPEQKARLRTLFPNALPQ